MGLTRDGRTPLYFQIYDLLRNKIEGGLYLPGDQLPTEAELSSEFSVSRITVKQAIQMLVNDGVLSRHQGKGTFVTKPKVQRKFKGLISFHDEMRQRGFAPSAKVLGYGVVPARRAIASALEISEGEKVVFLKRLRLADGEVMAVQTSYVPFALCPGLTDKVNTLDGSLYRLLREEFGVKPVRGSEEYDAVVVRGQDATVLGLPEGSPAFAVKRVAFDPEGRRVEYVESLLRADRYTLEIELGEGEL